MSTALIDLLAGAGAPAPRGGIAWDRVLLVNNVGAVPGDRVAGDLEENRGFNLVILDDDGGPMLFCKCRPTSAELRDRMAFTARLSRVPELADVVPLTWSVHAETIDAEVSRYIRGDLLERGISSMSGEELSVVLRDIIDAAATVSRHAAQVEPGLLLGPSDVELAGAAPWIGNALLDAGLDDRAWRTLESALARAGRVPRALQHGDLWPRNVLLSDGHWRIIDYEQYGSVQVPLYDALHLVRTSWDARPKQRNQGGAWIDELRSTGTEGAVYRATLRHAAGLAGLTPDQAAGALVYYVADVLGRMQRRRPLPPYATPFLLEARRLAEWIADGGQLEHIFRASDTDSPSALHPFRAALLHRHDVRA